MANNEEKKPVYKKWWFWLIVIIVVIGLAGAGESDTIQTGTDMKVETTQNQEKFTLVDSEGSFDGFGYYVSGTIKNNKDKEYSYVQVTFNLYDADGAQIGTAMDNINNLEANGTWKFKAIGITENVASYKLAEITGW